MTDLATYLFYLWVAAFLVAIWSLRIAQFFAWRMPKVAGRELPAKTPQVAVIVPIKGVDPDTEHNVAALLAQDYANYRLIFAVESAEDAVIPLLHRLADQLRESGKQNPTIDIAIAGHATDRGQKIHNQLAAFERTTEQDVILAFMDADANPKPDWLRAIVGNLILTPHIGCVTGYRYYVPETPTFVNHVLMVINAGVLALLGPFRRNFAWGGSMALRRADFIKFGVLDAWQHALSDDYVVSFVVKKQRPARPIAFIPQCIVASPAQFTWGRFWEFATRQYRITRVCAPLIWLCALLGPMLYLAAWGYTLVLSIWGFFAPLPVPGVHWHFVWMYLGLCAVTVLRGGCLLLSARIFLPAQWPAIRQGWFWFTFGMPVVHAVNLMVVAGSAIGRTITWRGITYRMISRTETRTVSATKQAAPTAEMMR